MGNDGPDYSNVAAGGQVNVTHPLHVEQHEDGGEDEISVSGLSGELADDQPAKVHKTSHEDDGGDEISLEGLSGMPAELVVIAATYNTDAEQNIPHVEIPIVNFDIKVQDTHNAVTTGAAWKFTAPESGFYLVCGTITYSTTTIWDDGELADLRVNVNGVHIINLSRKHLSVSTANIGLFLGGSQVVYLNVGDYLDIRTYQNSGDTLPLSVHTILNFVTIVKYAGS